MLSIVQCKEKAPIEANASFVFYWIKLALRERCSGAVMFGSP